VATRSVVDHENWRQLGELDHILAPMEKGVLERALLELEWLNAEFRAEIRGQVAVAWEVSAHGAATSVERVVAAAKRLGVKFDVETHPAPEQAGVCGGFFTHPPGVEDAAAELRALLEDHEIDDDLLPHAVSQPFLGIGPY
jgi:hypothetical protein